jgi:hypothetical protein
MSREMTELSIIQTRKIHMRSGDFSATIVVNGVENAGQADGVVPVGFGDEYAIRLRTHNGRRAVARIWVDGVELTQGGLVVDAHRHVDLETPPASPGSRFRFASTESSAARVAGKGGPDVDGTKGLIRIEFQSEKYPPPVARPTVMRDFGARRYGGDYMNFVPCGGSGHYSDVGAESCGPISMDCLSAGAPKACGMTPLESGVTVAGSRSTQNFHEVHIELDGPVVVVLLKLRGYNRMESTTYPAYSCSSPRVTSYCRYCGRQEDLLSNLCACGQRLR